MTKEEALNYTIAEYKKEGSIDTNLIRDGYHSFGELYEHRIELFIALCRIICFSDFRENSGFEENPIFKTSIENGWFILGIDNRKGMQITYHLPESRWDDVDFAVLRSDFEFDGHTSEDVLKRLQKL